MKKILLSIFAAMAIVPAANAWSPRVHFAIARVAEKHLTPQAKAALDNYLDRRSIVEIAIDADTYQGLWVRDLGFVPNNPSTARPAKIAGFNYDYPVQIAPYRHHQKLNANDALYPTNADGERFVPNMCYDVDCIAKKLKKEAKKMTDEERYKYIALLVHLVGDIHQPMKFAYESTKNTNYGSTRVYFGQKNFDKKKTSTLNSFWQDPCRVYGTEDLAIAVDTATPEEIAAITKGNIYTWTLESAMASKPKHVAKETILPTTGVYWVENRDFVFSQVRNAGYRLAALLNDIFAKYK